MASADTMNALNALQSKKRADTRTESELSEPSRRKTSKPVTQSWKFVKPDQWEFEFHKQFGMMINGAGKKKVRFITPKMQAPFGPAFMNNYTKVANDGPELPMECVIEEKGEHKEYFQKIQEIDKAGLKAAAVNSKKLWGKARKEDFLSEMVRASIQVPDADKIAEKEKAGKKISSLQRLTVCIKERAVARQKQGEIEHGWKPRNNIPFTQAYEKYQDEVTGRMCRRKMNIDQITPKSTIQAIVEPKFVKYGNGNWKIKYFCHQLLVELAQNEATEEFGFDTDCEDADADDYNGYGKE